MALPRPGRLPLLVAASALFVTAMLLADGASIPLQLLNGAATGLFIYLAVRSSPVAGLQVATAMTIATCGELVLSLGWELYTYRFAAVPWYVPPGHGIFYLLAAESALHPAFLRHRRAIVDGVAIAGTVTALVGLVLFGDTWGLFWWIAALTMMRHTSSGLLLACAWIYTMPLEWLGTWNGNWHWFADVPGLPLVSGNPPSGVAMLYGLLDLLTVAAVGSRWMRRLAGEETGGDEAEEPEGLADAA